MNKINKQIQKRQHFQSQNNLQNIMFSQPQHLIFVYTPQSKHIRLLQLQKYSPAQLLNQGISVPHMRDFLHYHSKVQQNFTFLSKRCYMLDSNLITIQKQMQSIAPLNYEKQYKKQLKKQIQNKIYYWFTGRQNIFIKNQQSRAYLSYREVHNFCFGRRHFVRSWNSIELQSDHISRDHCQLFVQQGRSKYDIRQFFNLLFKIDQNKYLANKPHKTLNSPPIKKSYKSKLNPINKLTMQLWQKIYDYIFLTRNKYFLVDNGSRNGSFFIEQQKYNQSKQLQNTNSNLWEYNSYGNKIQISHQINIKEGFSYEFEGEEYLIKVWRLTEHNKKLLGLSDKYTSELESSLRNGNLIQEKEHMNNKIKNSNQHCEGQKNKQSLPKRKQSKIYKNNLQLSNMSSLRMIKQFQQKINWYNNFQKVGKQYLIDQSLLKRQNWIGTLMYQKIYGNSKSKKPSVNKSKSQNQCQNSNNNTNLQRNNTPSNQRRNIHMREHSSAQVQREQQNQTHYINENYMNETNNGMFNLEQFLPVQNSLNLRQNYDPINYQPYEQTIYQSQMQSFSNGTSSNTVSREEESQQPKILSQFISRQQFINLILHQYIYLEQQNRKQLQKFNKTQFPSSSSQQPHPPNHQSYQQQRQTKQQQDYQKIYNNKNFIEKQQIQKYGNTNNNFTTMNANIKMNGLDDRKFKGFIAKKQQQNNNDDEEEAQLFTSKHKLNVLVLSLDFNYDYKKLYCLITFMDSPKKFHIGTQMVINTSRHEEFDQTNKCNGYVYFNGKCWQMIALKLVNMFNEGNPQTGNNNFRINNKKNNKNNGNKNRSQNESSGSQQQKSEVQDQKGQHNNHKNLINNKLNSKKQKKPINLQKVIGNKIWTKIPSASKYELNPKRCSKYYIRLAHSFYFQVKFINYEIQQNTIQKNS